MQKEYFMEQLILDGVDIFNPLSKEKLQDIIDCFVEYFGEDKREIISQRLNDVTYLFLGRQAKKKSTRDSILEYYESKIHSMDRELNLQMGIYEDSQTHTLFEKKEYILNKNLYKEKPLNEFTETALLSLAISVSSKDIIKDFNYDHIAFLDYVFDNEHDKLIKKYNESRELWEREFYDKYYECIVSAQKILPIYEEKENKVNDLIKQSKQKEMDLVKEILKEKLGINFAEYKSDQEKIINFFENSKNIATVDKQLENLDVFIDIIEKNSEFVTEYDKSRRTQLFDFYSICKGKQYEKREAFVKEIIKSSEIRKEIIKIREQLKRDIEENCPYIVAAREQLKIKNIGDLQKEIDKIKNFVVDESILSGYVTKFYADRQIKQACVVPQRLQLTDDVLIHEMMHIATTDIKIIKEIKKGIMLSGRIGINRIFEEEKSFLGEVINEYLSQQVCEIARRRGVSVGRANNYSCYYTQGIAYVKPFLDKHIEDIKSGLIVGEHDFFDKYYGVDFEREEKKLQKVFGYKNLKEAESNLIRLQNQHNNYEQNL